MESRLRQPGWGRKVANSRDRGDSSLPPILDRGARGGAPQVNLKSSRSSSVGVHGNIEDAEAETSSEPRAVQRRRSSSECSRTRADNSLPPLPGSAGDRQRRPSKQLEEASPKVSQAASSAQRQASPSQRQRADSRSRLSQATSSDVADAPDRGQRPPAGPRSCSRSRQHGNKQTPALQQAQEPDSYRASQRNSRSTSRRPEDEAAQDAEASPPARPSRRPPRASSVSRPQVQEAPPKSPPIRGAPSGTYSQAAAPREVDAASKSSTACVPSKATVNSLPTQPKSPPIKSSGGYPLPTPPKSPPLKASGAYAIPMNEEPAAPTRTRSKKDPPAVETPTPARARPPAQPSSAARVSKEKKTVSDVAAPAPHVESSGAPPSLLAEDSRPQSPPLPSAGNYSVPVAETPAFDAGQPMEGEELPSVLIPCDICGRKFNEKAHQKHVAICQKVFVDKRKAFNVVEQRLPEGAKPPRPEKNKKPIEPVEAKKAGWKQKSEAFRAALKEARLVQQYQKEGRSLSELPPPKATDPELDDRVPCPHCGRRFGDVQAQRHIPFCKNQKMKSRPGGTGAGRAGKR
eukprot:TRINITY_DN110806_c0_g1_i1.p1 TRINITY_DN110806_c0_g1~~TRINITY_DN110806_c0_g1_i1.p1  ORF type:complete len:581 (-),score=83.67 TRINITY_DN110806_c0_g1_i1:9-1730(-)